MPGTIPACEELDSESALRCNQCVTQRVNLLLDVRWVRNCAADFLAQNGGVLLPESMNYRLRGSHANSKRLSDLFARWRLPAVLNPNKHP